MLQHNTTNTLHKITIIQSTELVFHIIINAPIINYERIFCGEGRYLAWVEID